MQNNLSGDAISKGSPNHPRHAVKTGSTTAEVLNQNATGTLQNKKKRKRKPKKPATVNPAENENNPRTSTENSNKESSREGEAGDPNATATKPKKRKNKKKKSSVAAANSESQASPESPNDKPKEQQGRIKNQSPGKVQTISINKPKDSSTESNISSIKQQPIITSVTNSSTGTQNQPLMDTDKSREEVKAAREAKKLAKQLAKKGVKPENPPQESETPNHVANHVPAEPSTQIEVKTVASETSEKTREQIKAEREAKKQAKQAKKSTTESGKSVAEVAASAKTDDEKILQEKLKETTITGGNQDATKPKPAMTKAERRALQEAQREAKAKVLADKQQPQIQGKTPAEQKQAKQQTPAAQKLPIATDKQQKSEHPHKPGDNKVKLFNHLERTSTDQNTFVNNPNIHPAMVKLGEQYAKRTVVGSNARCIAFLNALKTVIQDYETPPKKEFGRGLEASIKTCVDHLQKCRPLAVSIINAHKCIKYVLTQLNSEQPDTELKEHLFEFIDTYIKDQIEKAAQAISSSVQEKISNGDVILTFGCSSLINHILEEAHRRKVDFRVILVDSRPFLEGQELLRRLVAKGIPCTCVLINAVGFIMPEVTKVLLGAHALLANGYVMARTGTAQVALVARSFNVPVLVCCETHKFSERVQTDAIVYNELGNPNDLVLKARSDSNRLSNWQSFPKLCPLNLNYDITPPELVTAVVTEVAILPCTSVPVILRIKPTEIGY